MNATQKLHDLGQCLWLDNVTRDLLTSWTLRRYIDQFSVTRLTSNPTILDTDIKNSSAYDTSSRENALSGKEAKAIFFDLALEDITQAADSFRPTYDHTDGVDGWVSIEVPERPRRICNFVVRPPRLLWPSTGTKDPTASDILYIEALATSFTVNTMPERTEVAS